MRSSDPDYPADLAHRILALISHDHVQADEQVVMIIVSSVYQALGIVAARIAGETFDQFAADERRIQARVLGAAIASTAETIWQTEVDLCEARDGSIH